MRAKFDPNKAVEVLMYISSKTGGDMYNTLKLIYLADKTHLENYGSLIIGDWYCAMDYGPVASYCYDILKHVRGDRNGSSAPHAADAFYLDGNNIVSKREPDLSYLSKSDIKCIDEVVKKYGDLSFGQLKKITHDDAYEATSRNGEIDIHAIASTLPNGAEVNQYLSDQYPD